MALNENGSSWLLDLENALEEDCATNNLSTCTMGECVPDSMRSDVWQICLDVQNKGNKLLFFNEIFDLPQQRLLRKDCQCFVEKLGNEEEDKVSVVSDLESLLTFYSKTSAQEYESGNGWIEILLPLMSLKLPLEDTYNLFEEVRNVFIPRNEGRNGLTFHLFRLLLLYHDPELCSFLDTKRITPDRYCVTWFQSLFAATCSLPVVLRMWDIYFQQRDPFLLFFLSLVMVMNGRDQILNLKNEDNQNIIDTLTSMPCALEVDDVADFCSLAKYYALKTPASFRTDLGDELFGIERSVDVAEYVSQSLCLPVNVRELIDNTKLCVELDRAKSVRFFLIDCRPAEQYNAGHLPTAFHLDSHLMLQEPSAFTTAVQGLLSAQRQSLAARSAAGGEHLCFLGSGRMEEDQYTHMVIASFLQKHTHYVSMLHGGYQAIHEYFGEEVNLHLAEHKLNKCLACVPLQKDNTALNSVQLNSGTYFLGKISAAMKLKSAAVKGRLIDYIVSPVATNAVDRHVSSSDKLEKSYRNIAPVFSIDDEQDPDFMGQLSPVKEESHDVVPLSVWLKKPEVIESFKCHEVKVNGHMFESNLLVTKSHIYVLRSIPGRRGYAQIKVRRPLSTIVKITSKKKHPEIITFKYGVPEGDSLVVSDLDKFVIPNAAEATQLISQQILEHLKSKEI